MSVFLDDTLRVYFEPRPNVSSLAGIYIFLDLYLMEPVRYSTILYQLKFAGFSLKTFKLQVVLSFDIPSLGELIEVLELIVHIRVDNIQK